ncbi:MAG: S41 family peptidase [Anaerolineales bacterium]|nr:S41 family peptidase [Anaerolineales bacterium]
MMASVKRACLLALLLLLTMPACLAGRFFSPAWWQVPTVSPTISPGYTPTRATATASPSPSATTSPEPTRPSSPSPSAPAPSATEAPVERGTPTPLQISVFEELWRIVHDEYLYPDYNGVDWQALHVEYRQRLEAGLSREEYYKLLDEMLARLGDDHSVFLSPEEVAEEDAEFSGKNDYVGIGVVTVAFQERSRVSVILVFPDSPAAEAGLRPHDNLLSVDGQPIVDEQGVHTQRLRGPEGTPVELLVQTPGGAPRRVVLTRRRIQGSLPVDYQVLRTPEGLRVGYLLLISFADDTIDEQVHMALEAMSAEAPLDGLILDNRQNNGGIDTVARNTLAYFTHGRLGYFADRRQHKQWLEVVGADVFGSSRFPLVVLVGQDTISYGEIFAGVLQDAGRAYLIGETTGGNIELLFSHQFADGSRAWIAQKSFHPTNHPEQNWEETGVIPDLTVLSNWDEVTLETDPVILAAQAYLEGLQ